MRRLVQLFLVLCLVAATGAAFADVVAVNRGAGMGYVFTYRGNCFLFLPYHVHGRSSQVSVRTSGAAAGSGTLLRTFHPGEDLSAVYMSGLDDGCSTRWETLPEDLRLVLPGLATALLVRVDATGRESRDEMIVTGFDFRTITARVADPSRETEIRQGTSGAILKSGDLVLGMAIESPDTGEALFLRADEIVSRLARLIEGDPVPEPVPPPVLSACPAGLAIVAVSCSAEPVSPEYGCTNLMTGGPVVFPAGTRNPRIVVEFDGDRQTPGSVTLRSDPAAGGVPRAVLVEATAAPGSAPRWTRFGALDMPPTGDVTVVNGARPYARRLAITLQSAWNPDAPLRLDCIAAQ